MMRSRHQQKPLIALILVFVLPSSLGSVIDNRASTELPSPSCMLSGDASADSSTTPLSYPCPVPQGWDVDWSVVNSTALMSTNPIGFHPVNHTWGWVTLDWQANRADWLNDDPTKTTCEASNAANCLALKKAGKVRRCTIYHNMELALEWLESNRAVMDEEHVNMGWFLRFQNGSVYDNKREPPSGTPNQPMPTLSQWFIDWRNRDAAAYVETQFRWYFVAAIVNASSLPGVDGTFTDDSAGAGTEHSTLGTILNISNATIAEIAFATQAGGNYLATVLAANGKTCFDCVGGQVSWTDANFGFNQRPPPRTQVYGKGQCSAWMRNYCAPAMQGRGMFMDWDVRGNATNHEQTMAAFLITRPPVAFIGSYMMRDGPDPFPPHKNAWDPLFNLDVGIPLGLCDEVKEDVFERKWSRGVASLDCSTYTATLNFKSFPSHAVSS